MKIADLVADGEECGRAFPVFRHPPGEWMGHPPTGQCFHSIDEVYIFPISGGKLAATSG